jgi:phosphatidylserine synthase 2
VNILNTISNYRGKMRRTVQQFTPASWTTFQWGATSSFKNYLITIFVVIGFLQAELNAFYLKYLLWIPPNHSINIVRLFMIALMGFGAIREVYQYFYDKQCKKLGPQAWIMFACVWTETLICVKFGKDEFPNPAPQEVVYFWIGLTTLLVTYPIYQFYLYPKCSKRPKVVIKQI